MPVGHAQGPSVFGVEFFHAEVVPQASAALGMKDAVPIHKDHIQICKPNATNAPAYARLHDFLKEHLSDGSQVGQSSTWPCLAHTE